MNADSSKSEVGFAMTYFAAQTRRQELQEKLLSDDEKRLLGGYATLTHQLGGEFVTIDGNDVAATVATYARGHRITEILVMRSGRNSSSKTLRRLIRLVADVDVHVVAANDA